MNVSRAQVVRAVTITLVVALALRLGHLAWMKAALAGTHLFDMSRGDATHHWQEARDILGGNPWLTDRIPWKGPGYSYFLAALMSVLGESPGVLRWPMAVLGSLNCAGLTWVGVRWLGSGWSTVAGLLAAVQGVLILFDGELLFPTLLISLSLGAVALLGRESPSIGQHAGAGLLMGIAVVVHPTYLLVAAPIGLTTLRNGRARAASFALAVALAIAPVTLTNAFVRDQPVLVSWNGGINLYAGNQPNFDQFSGNRTHAWGRVLQSTEDAGIGDEHLRDRFYYRLAATAALTHPLRTAGTLLQKTWLLLSPVEYANNMRIYELRDHSGVLALTLWRWGPLWFPFGLLGPLIVAGALLALRRRPHPLATLVAVWSSGLAASIVLSFHTARYRAPLVFFGCLFAAYALRIGCQRWARGDRRPVGLAAGGVALLGVLLAITAVPQRGFPFPFEWDEAMVLDGLGRATEADGWVERAVARVPDDPGLRLAAASHWSARGQREAERSELERMLSIPDLEPDLVALGHHHLARSLAADGRFNEARRELRAALAVGIDTATWHGHEHFQLGLGPLTDCWFRLSGAQIELAAGETGTARALIQRVRQDCPGASGRIERRMQELLTALVITGD